MRAETERDCGPWRGRVGNDEWLVLRVAGGLEVRTRDPLDPWSTWSVPTHLRPLPAEEVQP